MSDWKTIADRIGLKIQPLREWPRKPTWDRKPSPFSAPMKDTLDCLRRELQALAAKEVVLEVAIREDGFRLDGLPRAGAIAEHPGIILSLRCRHGLLRLYMDRFTKWESNLRAIAKHLENLRHAGMYGVGEDGQQYQGWKALPAGDGAGSRESAERLIRGLAGAENGAIEDAYRQAVRRCHPDTGGTRETFDALQAAWAVVSAA